MCFAPKSHNCDNQGCCNDEYTYKNIDGYKYDFTGSYSKEDIYKIMEKCNLQSKKNTYFLYLLVQI